MSAPNRSPEELLSASIEAARRDTDGGLEPLRARAVLRKVEDDLRPRSDSRLPGLRAAPWLAAVAAMVAAVVFWPTPAPEAPEAPTRVVFSMGRLTAGERPLEDATFVQPTTVLGLEEAARLDLVVTGARVAVLGPARVGRAPGRFLLHDGRAAFSVDPHPKDRPFVIRAPDGGEVIVHGTRFEVLVAHGKIDALDVLEGVVELKSDRAQRRVAAGGTYRAEGVPTAAPEDRFGAPWWTERGASLGHLYVASEPAGAEVWLDGNRMGEAPLLVRWPVGPHALELRLAGRSTWTGSATVMADRVARVSIGLEAKPEPEVAPDRGLTPARVRDPWAIAAAHLEARRCAALDRLVPELVRQSATRADKARAEILAAECRLRRGDRRRALSLFTDVAARYEGEKSGEAAAFERAKLEADLAMEGPALSSMEAYLARYPNGRFAEAAMIRRCELLLGLERQVEARRCLLDYQGRFPGALRENQATFLLATIDRLEGKWAAAAASYRIFLARAATSDQAEDARYQLVRCLRWGRLAGVPEAISAYLELHPEGRHAKEVRTWQAERK
ncbi:MAG: PEGA domain-containing protein [Deltaproteobacteria bacterium]|nr:PEGA domain-containing protein [Deltaproteobacteria bacterium]